MEQAHVPASRFVVAPAWIVTCEFALAYSVLTGACIWLVEQCQLPPSPGYVKPWMLGVTCGFVAVLPGMLFAAVGTVAMRRMTHAGRTLRQLKSSWIRGFVM